MHLYVCDFQGINVLLFMKNQGLLNTISVWFCMMYASSYRITKILVFPSQTQPASVNWFEKDHDMSKMVIFGNIWWHLMIFHDKSMSFIMIYHDKSWIVMTCHQPIQGGAQREPNIDPVYILASILGPPLRYIPGD